MGVHVRLRLGVAALGYFFLYLIYLWFALETELAHWISLVFIPAVGLSVAIRWWDRRPERIRLLPLVGLRRPGQGVREGMGWALAIGALAAVANMFTQNGPRIIERLSHPTSWLMLPVILLLMMVTAGFTEEFFFRGVLLSRLGDWWGSPPAALVVSSLCFGLYHFPYAYRVESWHLQGQAGAALLECLVPAVTGLMLGALYLRSHRNLWACVLAHGLVNLLPGLALLRIG